MPITSEQYNFKPVSASDVERILGASLPSFSRKRDLWLFDCPGSSAGRGNRKHSIKLTPRGYPSAHCFRNCDGADILERLGFERFDTPYQKNGRAQSPYSHANKASSTRIPTPARNEPSVADTAQFGARRALMGKRNRAEGVKPVHAWFKRFAPYARIPPDLCWLPAETLNASRLVSRTEGAGAMVYPLRRIGEWRGAPRGVALIFVDADGRKAQPDKLTLGLAEGGLADCVMLIGNLDGAHSLGVCEGFKDAVVAHALYARPVVALNRTPGGNHAALLKGVALPLYLHPDNGNGNAQWSELNFALQVRGATVRWYPPSDGHKDYGDMGHIQPSVCVKACELTLSDCRYADAPCPRCVEPECAAHPHTWGDYDYADNG